MKSLSKKMGSGIKILIIFSFFILLTTFTVSAETYTNNVIPAMTSATTPTGEVTASGTNCDDAFPWKAFDREITYFSETGYHGWVLQATTGWIQYHFPTAKTITKYRIYHGIGGLAR
ncbi:MAG: hypothetical protein ACM3KR_05355 [Deltaproteobacteria bacterium]